MKLFYTLLLTSAQLLCAQNVLVKFGADNQPFTGLTNYPIGTACVSFTTNAPGWSTNFTLPQYTTYVQGLYPAYLSASVAAGNTLAQSVSNNPAPLSFDSSIWFPSVYSASNYAAFLAMNAQIPLGMADSSNRLAAMTVVFNSWKSGTNSASQTNQLMVTTLQNSMVSWTYLNQLLVYLSRLGPGLPGIYQPASDPVGH